MGNRIHTALAPCNIGSVRGTDDTALTVTAHVTVGRSLSLSGPSGFSFLSTQVPLLESLG